MGISQPSQNCINTLMLFRWILIPVLPISSPQINFVLEWFVCAQGIACLTGSWPEIRFISESQLMNVIVFPSFVFLIFNAFN